MASIKRLPSGLWNVRIRRQGHKLATKSFINKVDADRWARTVESEMDRGLFVDRSEAEATTLAQALERYEREVTANKKGCHQEAKRITQWLKSDLAKRSLASLKGNDFACYRDKRLKMVASNTVRLELAIISHLFTVAAQEWGLPVSNPIQSIRKPKGSNARTRRLEGDEEARLLSACSSHSYLKRIVVLALETGMRQGEIVSLTWAEVDLGRSVIEKKDSKNGDGRTIPLTRKAIAALGDRGIGKIFRCYPREAWENALTSAKIEDFHFHDLRHEAISRLFERGMNVMEVKSVSGHKTLQMLARYTHLKPADLLQKMEVSSN